MTRTATTFSCMAHWKEIIALGLDGHVVFPFRWKEFLYHRGCSSNSKSILQAGVIAGGRDRKEGRKIVFFTPLDPFGDEAQEEIQQRLIEAEKECTETRNGRPHQDAVYWLQLASAQDKAIEVLIDKVSCIH